MRRSTTVALIRLPVLVGVLLAPLLVGPPDLLAAQNPGAQSRGDSVLVSDTIPVGDSLAGSDSARVADTSSVPVTSSPAPIVLGEDTLGFVYAATGLLSATERAAAIQDRLVGLRLGRASVDSVVVDADRVPPMILVGSDPILAVTAEDIAGLGLARAEALEFYAQMVREALMVPALDLRPRALLRSAGWVALTTLLLWIALRVLSRLHPKVRRWITDRIFKRFSRVKVQDVELVSREQIRTAVNGVVWVIRLGITAAMLAVYFPLVFSYFPATRRITEYLIGMILTPLTNAGLAFWGYLPNLFSIIVILAITLYISRLLKVVFDALETKRLRIRGFYPDWARPTFQLVRVFVLGFALVMIWPYLPNSDSRAFQGVAAFLGLLLTFGSASAVSNGVGGLVMVYMRPFQEGDRVRIADTMGDVVERGILVTRVRTPKNVVITIPNSQVLGSHIVNYSRVARSRGIILHTTVTIGYDVPWPEVHRALIAAAEGIDGLLDEPEPFVLQTALGDYAVSYELNVHTQSPKEMPRLYSEMHQNIQSEFDKAGIEITSPIYHAVRDGNPSTLPGHMDAPSESSTSD